MFNKRFRIAEKVIAISSLHQRVHELCADYLTDDEPDFEVVMSQDDIEYERIKSEKEDIAAEEEIAGDLFHLHTRSRSDIVQYNTCIGLTIGLDVMIYLLIDFCVPHIPVSRAHNVLLVLSP